MLKNLRTISSYTFAESTGSPFRLFSPCPVGIMA